MPLPKLIVIVGPTAVGKSDLADTIAREFQGEIVNADSRVVYRGMDIGTAKPMRDPDSPRGHYVSQGIEHHCVDLVEPDEEMTLALWRDAAERAIRAIRRRRDVPLVVGGTWLYITALVDNYGIPRVAPDSTLRAKLERRLADDGLDALAAELTARDPGASAVVDLRNPRRVIRALEVTLVTGKPFTEQLKRGSAPFDVLWLGVRRPMADIRTRIRHRVLAMLDAGLFEEVERLRDRFGCGVPAMSGIGYAEVCRALDGTCSKEEAVEAMVLHTEQFAKRQLKWFERDRRIRWVESIDTARSMITRFLSPTVA